MTEESRIAELEAMLSKGQPYTEEYVEGLETENERLKDKNERLSYEWKYSRQDVEGIDRLLDVMGAPTTQDSGFPYSIIGRLSKLTAQIVGESWAAKIKTLEAENAALRCHIRSIINFIPKGWDMPLGFSRVCRDAKQAIQSAKEGA